MESRYPQYDDEAEEDQGMDGRGRSRYSEAYDDIMNMLNGQHMPSSRAEEVRLSTYFDNPNRIVSWASLEGSEDSASLYSKRGDSPEEEEEELFDLPGAFEAFVNTRCPALKIRKPEPKTPPNKPKCPPAGMRFKQGTSQWIEYADMPENMPLPDIPELPERLSLRRIIHMVPESIGDEDSVVSTRRHSRSHSGSSSSSASTVSLTQIETSLATGMPLLATRDVPKSLYSFGDLDTIFSKRIGKIDVLNQTEHRPDRLNYMILTNSEKVKHIEEMRMYASENLETICTFDSKLGKPRLTVDSHLPKPLFNVCTGPEGKKVLRSMGWYTIVGVILHKPQSSSLKSAIEERYHGELLLTSKLEAEMKKPLAEFYIQRDNHNPIEDPVERIVGGKKGGEAWKHLVKLRKTEDMERSKTKNWYTFYEVLPSTRYFRKEIHPVTRAIRPYDYKVYKHSQREWVQTPLETKQFQALSTALKPLPTPRQTRRPWSSNRRPTPPEWYYKWNVQRHFEDLQPHTWRDEPGTHLFNRTGSLEWAIKEFNAYNNTIPSETDCASSINGEASRSTGSCSPQPPQKIPEIQVQDENGNVTKVSSWGWRQYEPVTTENMDQSLRKVKVWVKDLEGEGWKKRKPTWSDQPGGQPSDQPGGSGSGSGSDSGSR